ncbi:MAG: hypothetical protein Q9168_006238 [Polycauliona sp. 1 TL-2023]
MTGLCEVCNSQEICNLLHDVVEGPKDYYPEKASVRLGSWLELQSRRENCRLCDAVVSLLQESITKRLPSKYPIFQKTIKDVTCGLQRCKIDSAIAGYARIAISVEVRKNTYTGYTPVVFTLDDAFQVSATPPQLPRGNNPPVPPKGNPQITRQAPLQERSTIGPPEARILPDGYDPHLIREWLDQCLHQHGYACLWPSGEPILRIRLIDVQKHAIVEFPSAQNAEIPPYIALSWVWGSTKAQSGLSSKCAANAADNGFLKSFRLPPAVEDAITLVEQIGERFLWVDLLCIIQDDKVDKQWYIPRMGAIYSNSLFTVVANGMNGSQDGLPGVRPVARPRSQVICEFDGIFLISCLEPNLTYCSDPQAVSKFKEDDVVPPWATRGWTLQERLLARRCLVMGSRQMRWECLRASYCEETQFEHFPNGIEKDIVPAHEPMKSVFSWDLLRRPREEQSDYYQSFHKHFSSLLESYNGRNLSFESDALNALQGILNTLTSITGVGFFWGLPCSLFEQNLLWSTSGRSKRKLHDVPSWSWLNYRDSHTVDHDDGLLGGVAISCFCRTQPTEEGDFTLRQVTNARHYPFDLKHLNLNGSGLRTFEVSDVSPLLQSRIAPEFHLLFWADAIDVFWQRQDISYGISNAGNLLLEPQAGPITNTTKGKGSMPQSDQKMFTATFGMDSIRPSETDDRRVIGHATIDIQRFKDRREVDCTIVKVIADKDETRSTSNYNRALLIVEKDGIAQVVGQPIILKDIEDREWRQKLIVLG